MLVSQREHLCALAHFSHWMTRCRLAAEQLDEDFVDQFLNHHQPRCDCHATARRTRGDLSAGFGHLLDVLRPQRVIAERPSPTGPVAEDLRSFVAQELNRVNAVSHATAWASALRAYFRDRSTCGDVVHALLGLIASPARWALATLTRDLTPQKVQRG